MEIEKLLEISKEIYPKLINILESSDNSDESFDELIQILESRVIKENSNIIRSLLYYISKIVDNHHFTEDFFNKIKKFLKFFHSNIQAFTTSEELFEIYKNNPRILTILFECEIITPTEPLMKILLKEKMNEKFKYCHYLYKYVKKSIGKRKLKRIEFEIYNDYYSRSEKKEKGREEKTIDIESEQSTKNQISFRNKSNEINDFIENFENNCRNGEDDRYICYLIRQDLIDDFIIYMTKKSYSVNTKLENSIFETNSFLIGKKPSLIEYAAFFGSMMIFRYLYQNGAEITLTLWLYAIHSNNAELIHFLEEEKIEPYDETYEECLLESITCHHNDIANYIKDNLLNPTTKTNDNIYSCAYKSCNFCFFPNDLKSCIEKKCLSIFLSPLLLVKLAIPSSTKVIGYYPYSKLFYLIEIVIPSSLISIGDYAFQGCKSLKRISFDTPSSLESIGNYAFSECSSLTQISIPSSVTEIGYYAFSKCSSLTQISIPSSVTKIREKAFSGCSSLTQISIPSSVTKIGYYAFSKCSSLTQIPVSSSLNYIGINVFDGVKSLEITGDIKHIPKQFFSNCKSLTQITIPSSVTNIGEKAFSGCSSLTQISIPSSVTEIGNSAFSECSSLTQISIPSSVTEIRENAFSGCSSLAQISIPSSVTSIGDYSFYGCSSLAQISIPSSVTSIRDGAFYGCSSLTQISIPSSVTSIGYYSFLGCSSLTQISIPSSITKIGKYAFPVHTKVLRILV